MNILDIPWYFPDGKIPEITLEMKQRMNLVLFDPKYTDSDLVKFETDFNLWDMDCIEFVIYICTQTIPKDDKEILAILTTLVSSKTKHPQEWDFVVYWDETKFCKHIWILQKSGKVLSKWGKSKVIVHPIDFVPESYGTLVTFFKRKIL